MRSPTALLFAAALLVLSASVPVASASVFLPKSAGTRTAVGVVDVRSRRTSSDLSAARRRRLSGLSSGKNGAASAIPLAMAIPGYGVPEQIFVGGFANFLQVYNLVITARVLLSWFPQAQSVGVLQPVFAITDPYLNLFRGLIPPIFGLDLSILPAFFLLNVLTSSTAAIGCEIPDDFKRKLKGMRVRFTRTAAL